MSFNKYWSLFFFSLIRFKITINYTYFYLVLRQRENVRLNNLYFDIKLFLRVCYRKLQFHLRFSLV